MKNQWKRIRSVVLLAVLPLVATAAASAHQWMSDGNPISIDGNTQVTVDLDHLNSTRIHTVALNRAGAIEGRIATIDATSKEANGLSELKIFFVRNGEIAKETVTNADGTFIVQGLTEGAYSFVAAGENGFAAYGVRVVANNGTEELNVMEAAAVSPRLAVVKEILESRLPSEVAAQIIESADDASTQSVVGANRVRLANGTLKGHVVPLVGKIETVAGTTVHILKDTEQVAEVIADEKGAFMVNDLEPGVYNFVATGPSGFAAVSFEAIAQEEASSVSELIVQSDSDEVPVSAIAYQDLVPFDPGYADTFDVPLTNYQDTVFIDEYMDDDDDRIAYFDSYSPIEYAGESVGTGSAYGGSCASGGNFSGYSRGGGFGGGGFGGGGGGRLFGGSGIGRLLLLGGAIAIPLAVSGGDGNPVDPPPGSNNQ